MKKWLGIMLAVTAFVAFNPNAQAAETKDLQGIFEECGLGAMLFPRWPIGASVSNFTWDTGTTATTSGLTTPEACQGGDYRLASYIYQSYDAIEKDLAKGDGKYLDMLALLSNKRAEEKAAFLEEVRAKFRDAVAQESFSTLSRVEKSDVVFSIINDLG